MLSNEQELRQILENFDIEGTLVSLEMNREGHINTTFFSTFDDGGNPRKYTHQRINTFVFRNPDQLMENISLVTSHIQSKIAEAEDADRMCLEVVRTKAKTNLYIDDDGGCWRTYRYIDKVRTFKKIESARQAYLLGEAVGNFQLQLADFNGERLHETIPHFHDMRERYRQLRSAMKTNYEGRLGLVDDELAFLLENEVRGCILSDAMANSELPLRVTHNDTKISNVLFSEDASEALCIIDLDTVMPGTILFDTGDMIRTATSSAEEDEQDVSRVFCDVALHKALLKGYFSKATFLTDYERSLVVESGRTITQIMAVRFLTDFLNGDTYYHIAREGQNLDRARTQIKLIKDMDSKWDLLNNGV